MPITDWGGFEQLVAAMHETGGVEVKHNAKVRDRNGIERQVDVLITHTTGVYTHHIIAECKYWNKHVSRSVVDALATTVRELNASKGVIFTTRGFQRGAIQAASPLGIDLFKVRTLEPDEWLLPGQVVPVYRQVFSCGIGKVMITGIAAKEGAENPKILTFWYDAPPREYLVAEAKPQPGSPALSIAQLIGVFVQQKMIKDVAARGIIFACAEDEPVFLRGQGCLRPEAPIIIPQRQGYWEVSRIEMDVGFLVRQRRINYDQAADYQFVLALDDCINGTTRIARRERDEPTTQIEMHDRPRLPDDHYLRNGIVLHTFQRELFNFQQESVRFSSAPVSHPQRCQAFLARQLPGMDSLPYFEDD